MITLGNNKGRIINSTDYISKKYFHLLNIDIGNIDEVFVAATLNDKCTQVYIHWSQCFILYFIPFTYHYYHITCYIYAVKMK